VDFGLIATTSYIYNVELEGPVRPKDVRGAAGVGRNRAELSGPKKNNGF